MTSESIEVLIPVLDRGYVRLVDHMGSDLSVVNAAKASFAKESMRFEAKDGKLLSFLVREGHWSPFRHAFMTFEIKAPLMVCRQHWKYVVGSDHTLDGWNESSRRYITMEPEFYVPKKDEWRSAADNKKQGSGGPIGPWEGSQLTALMDEQILRDMGNYNLALEMGVAPELARGFLPMYFMYTSYRWSCSLQSAIHFLNERLAEDAQKEIQQYARAIYRLVQPRFPASLQEAVKMDT